MKYLYTGKEAKDIDRHAIGCMGMPGAVLMERAAMSAAAVIMKRENRQARILAVCGTGNNGGDAAATVRILHEQGWNTALTVIGESGHMTEDMKNQLILASNCGVPVLPPEALSDGVFDVVLDGLFGVGLSRDVEGVYEKIVREINRSDAVCYALDIPSGISADTGAVLNVAVSADCTITFGVNKMGLVLYPGCEYAGEVFVADIGFPAQSVQSVNPLHYTYEESDLIRLPHRPARSHKGTFGRVLVVAGSEAMSGACFFAAKAACLSGAGLVRVISPEINRNILLESLPEIIFSKPDELMEALIWADVLVVGPGIGTGAYAEKIMKTILSKSSVPTVIDGDGITVCSAYKQPFSGNIILTPHVKEMSRLTGKRVDELLDHMISSSIEAAKKWNCIMVHKDARTIVTDGKEAYINLSGNNGMATGGSGDVLAGLLGGFLAQGMSPFEAAALAVYVHGLAGDFKAEETGCYSLMASDILDGIPEILKRRKQ